MTKAIDIIEPARSYYLLSNDKKSKPILIGGRIKLEFALSGIKSDMVIATAGRPGRCLVLVDFSTEDVRLLARKADQTVMKIKAKN